MSHCQFTMALVGSWWNEADPSSVTRPPATAGFGIAFATATGAPDSVTVRLSIWIAHDVSKYPCAQEPHQCPHQ